MEEKMLTFFESFRLFLLNFTHFIVNIVLLKNVK